MKIIDALDDDFFDGRRVTVAANESTKGIWDLDETRGMTVRDGYYVRDTRRAARAAAVLNAVHDYIYAIKVNVAMGKRVPRAVRPGATVFVVTPCTVQEMPVNRSFEGLNKPKEIVAAASVPAKYRGGTFPQDNALRATRRHVLLTLFDSSGKVKADLKELVDHELAHTMANHVSYREEGNHLADFHRYMRFIASRRVPFPNFD